MNKDFIVTIAKYIRIIIWRYRFFDIEHRHYYYDDYAIKTSINRVMVRFLTSDTLDWDR